MMCTYKSHACTNTKNTHTHTHTLMHTCMHAYMHYTCIHALYMHTCIHARTHACMHAPTYLHTHTHTNTHTHTHTQTNYAARCTRSAHQGRILSALKPRKKDTPSRDNSLACPPLVHTYTLNRWRHGNIKAASIQQILRPLPPHSLTHACAI